MKIFFSIALASLLLSLGFHAQADDTSPAAKPSYREIDITRFKKPAEESNAPSVNVTVQCTDSTGRTFVRGKDGYDHCAQMNAAQANSKFSNAAPKPNPKPIDPNNPPPNSMQFKVGQ